MASRIVFTSLRRTFSSTHYPTTSSRALISRDITSRTVSRATEPTHVPKPIPLDIGSPSSFFSPASSTASSASSSSSSSRRRFNGFGSGSVFDRYGGPIIKVIVYSTAATLAMHLLYHRLALEELRISTNAKLKELEEEIAHLKAEQTNPVQHAVGGRGEFI
ncbi:hypothetical protein BGZ93_004197 [Podila epicladia]|nr:hypothetical protein BGZ92_008573 [Podila epicladia]KAG0096650.1 hypothetical protein BGZ93_004197 [Podila epicladia]